MNTSEAGSNESAFQTVYQTISGFVRSQKDRRFAPYLLASPYLLYMVALFVVPMAYMILVSFYTNVPVGTMEEILTLENYVEVFTSTYYRNILYVTVEISVLVTVVTVMLSYPIAYTIAIANPRHSNVFLLAIIAPLLVGNVVRAFGWFAVMGENGFVNQLLGLVGAEYTLLHTKAGLVIAIGSVLMPFVILILMSALYTIERSHIDAAYSLGGNRLQTFVYVTLPLSLPGIIGATLISFVLTMGTFATAQFIGMPKVTMIAPIIYNTTSTDLNWPLGAAMSFILLAVSLGLIYLYMEILNRKTGEGSLL